MIDIYTLIDKFDFTTDAGKLAYLDQKEFEVQDVWFKEEFYAGNLV